MVLRDSVNLLIKPSERKGSTSPKSGVLFERFRILSPESASEVMEASGTVFKFVKSVSMNSRRLK
jgi:hypothetical protein